MKEPVYCLICPRGGSDDIEEMEILGRTFKFIGCRRCWWCTYGPIRRQNMAETSGYRVEHFQGMHAVEDFVKRFLPYSWPWAMPEVDKVQPFDVAGYSHEYYFRRELLAACRAVEKVRCMICGRREGKRWTNHYSRDHGYPQRPLCSEQCEQRFIRNILREQTRREKERQCLRQGKKTLGEIRAFLRKPREACPSPAGESEPPPTSPS